jgi:GH25 family lysozyme M1 (1,4-beta-N-acetylmuramidase)
MTLKAIAAVSAMVALVTLLSIGPAAAQTFVSGIDVSVWQSTIDWSAVATDPKQIKFAIIKATEGTSSTDPNYAKNKAGAKAVGIKTGAYHFARPSTAPNDARLEADHFLSVANLTAGDIVPALDLEVAGGLSVQQLVDWTQQWLDEIAIVTGVKPMIYTSPAFWQKYLGNTSKFADQGFATLWIAHWTTATQPTVPANNWGGHGWTFWQWSDHQTVKGISAYVDGDRYNGTDFTPVLIPALVQGVSPNRLSQGAWSATVAVSGSGFRSGATASFNGIGVVVNAVKFVSAKRLNISVSVDPSATLGQRDLTVTNPDAKTGTCTACFTVALPNNAVTTGGRDPSGATWRMVGLNRAASNATVFSYGRATDTPLAGDWDGSGTFTPGVRGGNAWGLRNSNSTGHANITFLYGRATDTPFVGDWDGNGTFTPGVRGGNVWGLRNSNSTGHANIVFSYGLSTDTPLVGDWDGNGTFTPAVRRGNVWMFRNSNSTGPSNIRLSYGLSTDIPVVGDWNGDGIWTPGVYRPSTHQWFLKNTFSGVQSDVVFSAPSPGIAIVGNWDALNPAV